VAVIFAALSALKRMGAPLDGDVIAHLVVEEEIGGNGTLAMIRRGERADACIVLEPTSLRILPSVRGAVWFRATCTGRPGNSGRAQETIEARTGVRPAWFRAPFGARWFGMGGAQRRLGLTGVMWTTIGCDWKWNADAVYARLAKRAANGSILCLHDGRELRAKPDIGATVEAVRRLVPALLERGYELETIGRLFAAPGELRPGR